MLGRFKEHSAEACAATLGFIAGCIAMQLMIMVMALIFTDPSELRFTRADIAKAGHAEYYLDTATGKIEWRWKTPALSYSQTLNLPSTMSYFRGGR